MAFMLCPCWPLFFRPRGPPPIGTPARHESFDTFLGATVDRRQRTSNDYREEKMKLAAFKRKARPDTADAAKSMSVEAYQAAVDEGTVVKTLEGRGRLWVLEDASGRRVVYKQADKPEFYKKEKWALSTLGGHPRVVGLRNTVDRTCTLLLDYCEGGDLYHLLEQHPNGLGEPECRAIARPILQALVFAADRGVYHRDIKLENVFLGKEKGDVRVGDWGMATGRRRTNRSIGTYGYMAPEMLRGDQGVDLEKSDAWSVAVVLFSLFFANRPYEEPKPRGKPDAWLKAILKENWEAFWASHELSARKQPSGALQDLLERSMCPDPERRLSFREMLAHDWVAGNEAIV